LAPSRHARRTIALTLFALIALLAVMIVPGAATRWLYTGEPPQSAELLVVLGGGSAERARTALELYRAGYAPRIMVTDGSGHPDIAFEALEQAGVPRRALVSPLRPATSTVEDVLAIRQIVVRHGIRSVLVVTSPYHCRRVALSLRRLMGDIDMEWTVTPSTSLYMDENSWWLSRQGWITVAKEFPKLAWYWLTVRG